MNLDFHGVTKIKIYENVVVPDEDSLCTNEFKIVEIEVTDREGTHGVSSFMERTKLSVRKTSDSLVDRMIEVVPK